MIRYIDLSNQIYDDEGLHFAFYDTVDCKFVEFSGSQEWLDVNHFIEDFCGEGDIYRYLSLIVKK